VVEKILLRGETLPTTWGCDGTSGYDFMNEVSALQHDARRSAAGRGLASVSGRPADFAAEEQAARREIIARSFSASSTPAPRASIGWPRWKARIEPRRAAPRADRAAGAFSGLSHLRTATARPAERSRLSSIAPCRREGDLSSGDRAVVDRLHRWLAAPVRRRSAALQARAVTRFQQLSAPIAAKAVEDTAFYRYGRLLSRNDVGFDVERFGLERRRFPRRVQRRHR
jgi:(1->4)-alpha-D-glucan 1-alpha-D-glucosylmutase